MNQRLIVSSKSPKQNTTNKNAERGKPLVQLAGYRVVLDTNIVVRALINVRSDCGRILIACEQRTVIPLLSREVLAEYRFILAEPALIKRHPELKRPGVADSVERLLYVSDIYRRITTRFEYRRDPKDAKLIELAIAGRATHLITNDDDLLTLPTGRDEAARRFRQRLPRMRAMRPEDFVRVYGRELGIER